MVAVSGGPDSCCLIDILAFLSRKYSFKLAIAHVNYQLRGADSVADEQFVKALAQQYALPCFIKRYPKNSTQRDEEVLRNFRYTFFEDLSKKHRFDSIALGHQKNDQAETFLLNLLRGSGPLGLAGMPPKYQHRIRPLLVLNREEVLRYLEARSLPFRLDTSNHDARYTRNRIRHELLPLLEERFNPNIIGTLARSATLFQNSLTKQSRSQNIPHGKRSKKTARTIENPAQTC